MEVESEVLLHTWDLAPRQVMAVQVELRERLVLAWDGREIATVCGVDVSVEVVLGCCTRYRLPGPIRWAHRVAGGAVLAGS